MYILKSVYLQRTSLETQIKELQTRDRDPTHEDQDFQNTVSRRLETQVSRAPSLIIIITSCRLAAATICSRPSPPPVGAEAPRAAEQTET